MTVILDTEGNIFGGFTPVAWESRKWNGLYFEKNNCLKADASLRSFLFTLINPHNVSARKFALKTEERKRAIACDSEWGHLFVILVFRITATKTWKVSRCILDPLTATVVNWAEDQIPTRFSRRRGISKSGKSRSSRSSTKWLFHANPSSLARTMACPERDFSGGFMIKKERSNAPD
jgi:hypothetical protein